METVVCRFCGQKVEIGPNSPSQNCPNCLEFLSASETEGVGLGPISGVKTANNPSPSPAGLVFTYQKTGEQIIVPFAPATVLGREAVGRQVLRDNRISRQHCIIEYVSGRYIVTDLGSKNGTFVGVDRVDCKTNPRQALEDNSVLFLGKELLFVKLGVPQTSLTQLTSSDAQKPETRETASRDNGVPNEEGQKHIGFECSICHKYRAAERPEDGVCPLCNGYND